MSRQRATIETVITRGGIERGYNLCLCSVCGLVAKCTPSFDYYTTSDPFGLLKCETCFWDYARTVLKESGHGDKVDKLDKAIVENRKTV